jgi:hypothetical protein
MPNDRKFNFEYTYVYQVCLWVKKWHGCHIVA